MRFSYVDSMFDPSFYGPLAVAVEDAGYDTFLIPESLAFPAESVTHYPYNADGTREFLEDKPFLDPFVLAPMLGALTTRLRFATFVLKLPLRHPVLVAKAAMSVAVLTGNRFVLGVGTSPWVEDYAICEVPRAGRGARCDEGVEVVRALSAGGFAEYHGTYYDVPRIKMSPVPTEPIPILSGGHGEPALRRAARLCDGWMYAGGGTDDLRLLLDRLAALRREYDRASLPFDIHAATLDAYTVDGVRLLEDLGVTDVVVGFRDPYVAGPDPQTLQEKIDLARGYADTVIAAVNG